jgi:DNA-binding Lrp family transcriptional regulator
MPPAPGSVLAIREPSQKIMHGMKKIDPIDERILQALAQNARLSNVQLGERAGLSPSACSRRVAELERSGAILG